MNELGLSIGTTTEFDKLLKPYLSLEDRVKKGQRIHAFLSGGGLRVVFLADPGKGPCSASKSGGGYGEHPYIEAALALAEDDCAVGGRPYDEVYGNLVQHFVTGTSEASSALDRWILNGRNFDISFQDNKFVFEGEYYYQYPFPKDKQDKVIQAFKDFRVAREKWLKTEPGTHERTVCHAAMREYDSQQVVVYEQEGITFELSPFVFPGNGEIGCTRKALHVPKGRDAHFEKRTFRYEGGETLLDHIKQVNEALVQHFKECDNANK